MPGIMDMIWPNAFVVQSIHVAARLGIADVLDAKPRTIDELAAAVGAHAPSLRRLLRALAVRPDGRLLLLEGISKPPNEPDPGKFLDVWFIGDGGGERTEAENRDLLRRGGFVLARVVPTVRSGAILESRPV